MTTRSASRLKPMSRSFVLAEEPWGIPAYDTGADSNMYMDAWRRIVLHSASANLLRKLLNARV